MDTVEGPSRLQRPHFRMLSSSSHTPSLSPFPIRVNSNIQPLQVGWLCLLPVLSTRASCGGGVDIFFTYRVKRCEKAEETVKDKHRAICSGVKNWQEMELVCGVGCMYCKQR